MTIDFRSNDWCSLSVTNKIVPRDNIKFIDEHTTSTTFSSTTMVSTAPSGIQINADGNDFKAWAHFGISSVVIIVIALVVLVAIVAAIAS